MGGKDMDRIRSIVFTLALLLFTTSYLGYIKAEEVRLTCAHVQNVSLSEYLPETSVENSYENHKSTNDTNIHSTDIHNTDIHNTDTHNTKIRKENLVLKWSFGITFVLLAISISHLFILLRKYKSLKNHEVSDNEPTIEIEPANNQYNDIDTDGTNNEAINMFRSIDKTMRDEKLYTKIDFTRDTMIRMFNTNKNKLNEALMVGCGMNYSKYICELRLQESIRIIEEDNNISLNDLAMHCGFNTYSSFYRSFCKRFGMGPADYKFECKKKHKPSK